MHTSTGVRLQTLIEHRCPDCGLPMLACDALALYRTAYQKLQTGCWHEADELANAAEKTHTLYLKRAPTIACVGDSTRGASCS